MSADNSSRGSIASSVKDWRRVCAAAGSAPPQRAKASRSSLLRIDGLKMLRVQRDVRARIPARDETPPRPSIMKIEPQPLLLLLRLPLRFSFYLRGQYGLFILR